MSLEATAAMPPPPGGTGGGVVSPASLSLPKRTAAVVSLRIENACVGPSVSKGGLENMLWTLSLCCGHFKCRVTRNDRSTLDAPGAVALAELDVEFITTGISLRILVAARETARVSASRWPRKSAIKIILMYFVRRPNVAEVSYSTTLRSPTIRMAGARSLSLSVITPPAASLGPSSPLSFVPGRQNFGTIDPPFRSMSCTQV
mmetsp:Transcript_16162/g.38075  ORF Transcript_16162/g.38075 Transcript_16162/m.38075 type:complete len:203 (-) Transcript_16162:1527-2135(-)